MSKKRYICSLYRSDVSFTEPDILKTLTALEAIDLGFFPARIVASKKKSIEVPQPTAFARSLVPKAFYIDAGCARIPFEGANGLEFVFTESSAPHLYPATFSIEFTGDDLERLRWNASTLRGLMSATVDGFEADYGFVLDEDQIATEEYGERRLLVSSRDVPVAMHWINYFGREWADRIGVRRLQALKPEFGVDCRANGGVIVTIQEKPFDYLNPTDRLRQGSAEDAVGLRDLQRRFANRGVG